MLNTVKIREDIDWILNYIKMFYIKFIKNNTFLIVYK